MGSHLIKFVFIFYFNILFFIINGSDIIDDIKNDLSQKEVVDFVLILDRSQGIERKDFYGDVRKFAMYIVENYALIDPSYVRISVITFAMDVTVPIDLISGNYTLNSKYSIFNDDNGLWDTLVYNADPAVAEGTYMRIAFQKAKEILEIGKRIRSNSKQIVMIVTDGNLKRQEHDAFEIASELKQSGIIIYSVGAGSWLQIGNVRGVANDGYYQEFASAVTMLNDNPMSWTQDTPPIWRVVNADDCDPPCENGGCHANSYTGFTKCLCNPGYTSVDGICQECLNNSYKEDSSNELCQRCPPGYETNSSGSTLRSECKCANSSINCTEDDLSLPDPCTNDTACADNQLCWNWITVAECGACKTGFTGADCSTNINNCKDNPCKNEATCMDCVDDYFCVCSWGFMGKDCEIDIDDCKYDPCENNATCVDTTNRFECDCLEDYEGAYCQDKKKPPTTEPSVRDWQVHDNIADCKEHSTFECTSMTICMKDMRNDGYYTCSCGQGYEYVNGSCSECKENFYKDVISNTPCEACINTGAIGTGNIKCLDVKPIVKEKIARWIYFVVAASGAFILIAIILSIIVYVTVNRRRKRALREAQIAKEELNTLRRETAKRRGSSHRFTRKSIGNTISKAFNGFWRRKSLHSEMFENYDNPQQGTPTAPPRPDLVGDVEQGCDVDEMEMQNTSVKATPGMEGWKSYLNDLQTNLLITAGFVADIDGGKLSNTLNYPVDQDEINRIDDMMRVAKAGTKMAIQGKEYLIEENDLEIALGANLQNDVKYSLLLSRTRKYLILLVGPTPDGAAATRLFTELTWITNHIKGEGY